ILYELCAGSAPFERPTVAEIFGAILYEQPRPLRELLPEVPEALDQAVLRCLQKDRAARPANVAELVRALLPFAASTTRASLDRTSGVLRRAGVRVDSVPPPSQVPLSSVAQQANRGDPPRPPVSGPITSAGAISSPVGAQTRTAWDRASQGP